MHERPAQPLNRALRRGQTGSRCAPGREAARRAAQPSDATSRGTRSLAGLARARCSAPRRPGAAAAAGGLYGDGIDLGKQATDQQHFTTGLDPGAEAHLQRFGLRTPHPILFKCHHETAAHDKCVFQVPHHQGEVCVGRQGAAGACWCVLVRAGACTRQRRRGGPERSACGPNSPHAGQYMFNLLQLTGSKRWAGRPPHPLPCPPAGALAPRACWCMAPARRPCCRCIDVGTYTGYSALVAALAVPDAEEGGLVVACDVNANYMDWAHRWAAPACCRPEPGAACGQQLGSCARPPRRAAPDEALMNQLACALLAGHGPWQVL